jgi:RNA polymerase sigma factor (sigma-70 family)
MSGDDLPNDEAGVPPINGLAAAVLGASEVTIFENLYVAHAAEARSTALAILGDPQLASDAVHSGFLEMLRYLIGGHRWYEPADARHMVLRNVRWAALKIHRTRRRLELGAAPEPDEAGDEAAWARSEARAICEQVVSQLRSSHRTVIRLHFVDGLSNIEAARRLGVTVGVFESRLQRAVRAARRAARGAGLLPQAGLLLDATWRRLRERRRYLLPAAKRVAIAMAAITAVASAVHALPAAPVSPVGLGGGHRLVATESAGTVMVSIDTSVVLDAVALSRHEVLALGSGDRCGCLVVFHSGDGGASWQAMPGPAIQRSSPRIGVTAAYPIDPRIVVDPGDGGPAEISPRDGERFALSPMRLDVRNDVHARRCGPAAPVVFCASGAAAAVGPQGSPGTLLALANDRFVYFRPSGGVLCSSDGGRTWSPRCPSTGE